MRYYLVFLHFISELFLKPISYKIILSHAISCQASLCNITPFLNLILDFSSKSLKIKPERMELFYGEHTTDKGKPFGMQSHW